MKVEDAVVVSLHPWELCEFDDFFPVIRSDLMLDERQAIIYVAPELAPCRTQRNHLSEARPQPRLCHPLPCVGRNEQTFQVVKAIGAKCAWFGLDSLCFLSSEKIKACELAQQLHYEWIWIDTCCIDKQ